jgi:predicted AlkP superfamily phosphohydrolase/phosphomutase
LVNSSFFAGTTIADYISFQELQAGLISFPLTYPPWSINGFIVAGFPTPQSINYSNPANLADKYGKLSLPTDFPIYSQKKKTRVSLSLVEARLALTLDSIAKGNYHFIGVVLNNLDIAHHHFWHTLDSDDPGKNIVLKEYQIADRAVGRLIDAMPEDSLIIIISDHGGGPSPTTFFNTNFWLSQMGWLTPIHSKITVSECIYHIFAWLKDHVPFKEYFKRYLPLRLRQEFSFRVQNISSVDWSRSKAYRVPMSPPVEGIHINVKGRQPKGIVQNNDEYERLREKIIKELLLIKDSKNQKPLVTKVFKREEIYSGEYLERAPDIVFFLDPRYRGGAGMKELITPVPKYDLKMWSGNHTMNGIFIAYQSHSVNKGKVIKGAQIIDIAPTILFYMGLPIPGDMDGKILVDIFEQSFLDENLVQHIKSISAAYKREKLSESEEEDMRKKLKGLGYLS